MLKVKMDIKNSGAAINGLTSELALKYLRHPAILDELRG